MIALLFILAALAVLTSNWIDKAMAIGGGAIGSLFGADADAKAYAADRARADAKFAKGVGAWSRGDVRAGQMEDLQLERMAASDRAFRSIGDLSRRSVLHSSAANEADIQTAMQD